MDDILNEESTLEKEIHQLEISKNNNDKKGFWKTQPVPQNILQFNKSGPLKQPSQINHPQTPYQLPDFLQWCLIDLNNTEQLEEVYQFLLENYVEDSSCSFRFDYSQEFLKWALLPPGQNKDYIFGFTNLEQNSQLMGFISGVPEEIVVDQTHVKTVEINFLCVHKILRKLKLAPLLIQEMQRKANINNIYQAIYTSGTQLPTPFSTTKYYHKNINTKKLVECKFTYIPYNMTLEQFIDNDKIPNEPRIKELQSLQSTDLVQLVDFMNKELQKFRVHFHYDIKEVEHFFLNREDIIQTFIVKQDNQITDMISYFYISTQVLNNDLHKKIKVAYSFISIHTNVNYSFADLMLDVLIHAKKQGCDVFNALNVMDNQQFINTLNFKQGNGTLFYYLYNWGIEKIVKPSELAVVLM